MDDFEARFVSPEDAEVPAESSLLEDATREEFPEASAEAQRRWSVRLSGPVVSPLLVYVLTRVVLVLVWFYAWTVSQFAGLGQMLAGWYGQDYLAVAGTGYGAASSLASKAMFPGYPVLIRVVHEVTRLSLIESAILISWVAGGFFVVLAGMLVAEVYGDAAGRRAGILLGVFPGSMVIGLPYAEALALALSAWALLSMERDHPARAGAAGALAGLCSPLATPIVLALGVRAWRTRDGVLGGAAGLALLGPIAALGFVSELSGSVLTWPRAAHRALGASFSLVSAATHLAHWPGIALTELASIAVLVGAIVALWRVRLPLEWIVYSAAVVLAALLNASTLLNPRFLLDAYPLLLGLGVWLKRDAFRGISYAFASLLPVVFLLYMTLGNVMGPP